MSEYGSVTQCPHCKTSFHVGPIQLEAANGHVRCGGCLKVFDANEHFIIEQKPLFGASAENKKPQKDTAFESDEELQPDREPQPDGELQHNEESQSDEQLEPDEELSIIPERFSAENDDDFHQANDIISEEAEEEIIEENSSDSDLDPSLSADLKAEQIEQEEMEAIYRGYDDPELTQENDIEEAEEEPLSNNKSNFNLNIDELSAGESEYNAIDSILDEAYNELEEDLSSPAEDDSSDREDDWQSVVAERTGANAEEPVLSKRADIDEDEELAEQLFVDSGKRRTHKKLSAPWVIATTTLVVILIAQTLYWQPSTLRQNNFYNQVSLNYCAMLPCRELILQDLSQLYVTGLVRPSEEYNNALSVQVELRNRAEQAQRFPHIELAFTDLRGQKISLRRFGPDEYLRAETAGRTVLEPFQRVQIEMELYDPGASAISYEFNLLYLE